MNFSTAGSLLLTHAQACNYWDIANSALACIHTVACYEGSISRPPADAKASFNSGRGFSLANESAGIDDDK